MKGSDSDWNGEIGGRCRQHLLNLLRGFLYGLLRHQAPGRNEISSGSQWNNPRAGRENGAFRVRQGVRPMRGIYQSAMCCMDMLLSEVAAS
jgi:hypothetical protein